MSAMKMEKVKTIDNATEACKVLMGLMETPQICGLHFEFDIVRGSTPIVRYKVERFVYPEDA